MASSNEKNKSLNPWQAGTFNISVTDADIFKQTSEQQKDRNQTAEANVPFSPAPFPLPAAGCRP